MVIYSNVKVCNFIYKYLFQELKLKIKNKKKMISKRVFNFLPKTFTKFTPLFSFTAKAKPSPTDNFKLFTPPTFSDIIDVKKYGLVAGENSNMPNP